MGRRELWEALRRRGTFDVIKMDFLIPEYLGKLLWHRRDVYCLADTDFQKELQSLIDTVCIN